MTARALTKKTFFAPGTSIHPTLNHLELYMKLATFIAVVLVTGLAFTAADTQAQVRPGRVMNAAAQTAADSWMNLIDDGTYARAWEVSSDLFKSRISQE